MREENGVFEDVVHINIELSNLCNYSHLHKKCPAHTRTDKRILPASCVHDILDTLNKHQYGAGKSIAFYLYSDSMNDPRLFNFLSYAKEKCPKSNIIVGTNGWYLTDGMAIELFEAGCTYLLVSSYTDSEHTRLCEVRKNVAKLNQTASFSIRRVHSLDNRITMHSDNEGQCFAPLTEVLVGPDGRTRLCCMDINQEYSYGNVLEDGFEKVISDNYEYLLGLQKELIKGIRNLQLCKECKFKGRMCGMYQSKKDPRPPQDRLERYA